jgi:5'-methylthioadenosine phosphorylase
MATDYDCWHPHHEAVTVDQVIALVNANAALAKRIVAATKGA